MDPLEQTKIESYKLASLVESPVYRIATVWLFACLAPFTTEPVFAVTAKTHAPAKAACLIFILLLVIYEGFLAANQ